MIIRLEKIILIMHKLYRNHYNHYYHNIDHDQHDDHDYQVNNDQQ